MCNYTYISSSFYLKRIPKEEFDTFYRDRTFIEVIDKLKFTNQKDNVVELEVSRLEQFESDEKMTKYEGNRLMVEQLIKVINKGKKDTLPPIFVRKYNDYYQVIDGHHRLFAHKKTNQEKIKSIVIPEENLKFIRFI